ncbi:MAG: hypothetical protein H6658_11115 [Ardenticatenaceae bacterium]|nr:hypothetical protein [Ardenticatenaceae bacterium]
MQHKLFAFFKSFSIGLKDGILILIALAVISPFVYREVLERTASNSDVVIGSVDVSHAELPIRPSTPTPVALITPTPTMMPTPTLRPTAVPTTNAAPTTAPSKPEVDGGFIQLTLQGLRAGLWTQVQWLAGDGQWYDVNGWAGHLTENNDVLWFVGQNHLGAQPTFRWLVYDAEGGTLLATSDGFLLPTAAKETIHVTITLPSD